MSNKTRCDWANKSALEANYHDTIWGVPVHDDTILFRYLILEGKQAGLSWSTILKKMDMLCTAFDDFIPEKLITYDESKIESLLKNDGIIKNRLKVNAVVRNAAVYFDICKKYGSLDTFLWNFVDGKPIQNHWKDISEVPATTPLSDKMSKALKKEGFQFVGSTTVYAFMQAVGIVNDHLITCFCHPDNA